MLWVIYVYSLGGLYRKAGGRLPVLNPVATVLLLLSTALADGAAGAGSPFRGRVVRTARALQENSQITSKSSF